MDKERIAAIYTRVSTREQAEAGYSIEEQEKLLRTYCTENQIALYKVYSDKGISGKSIKGRPGIQNMLADAELKKFDIILVWRFNRLSRRLLDTLQIVEKLSYKNIELKSITEMTELNTLQGRLQLHIMSSFGEYERGQIAENVKMGMDARAKEGRWNGGIVLGYDLIDVPDSNRKRGENMLVINKKEADVVKHIFDLYYNGKGYKSIANQLNKEGYQTKKGNPFAITSIKDIVSNPLYSGMIRYDVRSNWASKRRRGINPNPILVPGIHEPIISKEMFAKVQELIRAKSGKSNKTFAGSYPLTGILRCPVCNSGMVAGRVVSTRKDGTKNVIRYYYCGAWRNKGTAVCRSNGVRADDVENYVFQKIRRLVNSDSFLKATLSKVNGKRRDMILPAESNVKDIEKEIQALTKNREQYFKLMEKRAIDEVILLQKLQEISDNIAKLESDKTTQEGYLDTSEVLEIPYELVKATLEEFSELLNISASDEEKKTLLHLLIDEIKIGNHRRPESITIKFNSVLVNYITANGGLPKEGNPLFRFDRIMDLGLLDFRVSI
ncbi:MAG TPA: resolvase [Rikenellaceae bacterium]|nr:resolvase [Rikenellaceae bacterium]